MMKETAAQDLRLSSYHYPLPEELIASRPVAPRDSSRLMYYKKGGVVGHYSFSQLGDLLPSGSLLVLNSSKVFPCRLLGHKDSGGKCEILILSLGEAGVERSYPCLVKSGGKKAVGDTYFFAEDAVAKIVQVVGDGTFRLSFNKDLSPYLQRHGSVPIPPYIRDGLSDGRDLDDYQTVYAREVGSVAAPTAGLHFTPHLLTSLEERGVEIAYITLHVGTGTFAPVTTDDISRHHMSAEKFFVEDEHLLKLQRARSEGRPIYAVGTTSLRVLETILQGEQFVFAGDDWGVTDIFLRPGVEVRSISGLITNFHLPASSPLMLVSSLVGREKILSLYQCAVDRGYRFYSYGDAMLLDFFNPIGEV